MRSNSKTTTKEKTLLSLHPKISELIDELAAKEFQNRSSYITTLILREARAKGLYNDFNENENEE